MEGGAWDDELTAARYAEFCERHSMYAATSADLVRLAGVAGDMTVVDVACGTGQTTAALLAALGSGARVHAVDSSTAMLGEARRRIDDPRVRWHHATAEALADILPTGAADAVVCNSAIWQTRMDETFAAIAAVLRPGGRFACNIGGQFLILPSTEEELHPRSASLHDVAQAIAVLDHGHVPRPRRGGRRLTTEHIQALLESAGLRPEPPQLLHYDDSVERQVGWLSIPIFGRQLFPDLTEEARAEVLAAAAARVTEDPPAARWAAFVGVAPSR